MDQFLTTYEETEAWLKDMGIENYTIHEDLTVDVNDYVGINGKSLACIPVQFGTITEVFDCSNNNLESLKGSPHTVLSDFNCNNNKLLTLEFCPQTVKVDLNCSWNNLLNLNGAPHEVNELNCVHNNLTSLMGCSKVINKNLYCYANPMTDFSYLDFQIKGNIYFTPMFGMDYLDKLKDKDGDVSTSFNNFKKLYALNELNKKLNNDLLINAQVLSKHKI